MLWLIVPLARWLGQKRIAQGRPRALWGVTPILTLPLKARATRLLGIHSTSVVFETYFITQDFDLNLRRLANGAARLGSFAGATMDRLILIWALLRFDVFHYFFDRGLMRPNERFGIRIEELDLLKAAGKPVFAFAYGADVRMREATLALGRWNFCVECPEPGRFCLCSDGPGVKSLADACARLTAPVALGDMLSFLPRARNLHYWPIDTEAVDPLPVWRTEGPLRIVHAPNHTHFKGSRHLEAAINALRAEGHAIEYVKIQGEPNSEVLRLFGEADIVADQFIGGAYGYTALEAMVRSKPVLTYVRDPGLVEAVQECPLINATPDTLQGALQWCLAHRDELRRIGLQGRAYVERWHSVDAVAARLGMLYLETDVFPDAIAQNLKRKLQAEEMRRNAIPVMAFYHPFRIDAAGCAALEDARLK